MRSMVRLNNHGFSFLELAIAMLLITISIGIVSAIQGRVTAAQGARTVKEMQSILDAARQYYPQNNNTWPTTMKQIQVFLPYIIVDTAGNSKNIFGNQYILINNGETFLVQTKVPSKSTNLIKDGRFASILSDDGILSQIQCSTTVPVDNSVGRLQYVYKYSQ